MARQIATFYHRWMRWQEDLNRRLGRGGLIGLLLVLSLGCIEPLACIAHCTLLGRLDPGASRAAHHYHDHLAATGQALVGDCHLVGSPNAPLAQALHEVAPPPAAVVALVLAPVSAPRRSLLPLPRQTLPPPLRPPKFL